MRGQFIAEAHAQAQAMIAVLERDDPGVRGRLRENPMVELQSWPSIRVVLVDESTGTDRCSVAGSYEDKAIPPTLVVARAASTRRRGFTALHELGHHLQQTNLELGAALYQVSDPELLQEESCDAFAAQILLPDADLAHRIGPRGPFAQDVVELFTQRSSASREACCVWAARHLGGAGTVILLEANGIVLFAASRTFIPPARKFDQSGTPLIKAALDRGNGVVTRDSTYVQYRNGGRSEEVYGQAAWFDEDYLVAILARDNVPWKPLALPRPGTERSSFGSWRICATCDDHFQVTEAPCPTCGEPRCRDGHCGCTSGRGTSDRLCSRCDLVLAPSRFAPGAALCKDCD